MHRPQPLSSPSGMWPLGCPSTNVQCVWDQFSGTSLLWLSVCLPRHTALKINYLFSWNAGKWKRKAFLMLFAWNPGDKRQVARAARSVKNPTNVNKNLYKRLVLFSVPVCKSFKMLTFSLQKLYSGSHQCTWSLNAAAERKQLVVCAES